MVTFNERDDIRERYGKPQRPAVQFTRRDDVRDLMKSPQGQNYGNMLDLQSQAIRQGGFDKGDPRVAELKKARRQYNRHDKYNIGNLMGHGPTDVQDIYRQNSGVLREHAKPTYREMYPIADRIQGFTGSGGLTGMLLNKAFGKSKKAGKNFLDDLRGMGGDIFGAVGIGGAVPRDEATEEVLTNYATETFGPHLKDIEELDITDEYEGPWPHEDMPTFPDIYRGPRPHEGLPSLDVYEGPRPHEGIPLPLGTAPLEDVEISDLPDEPLRVQKRDWVDDITETDTMPGSPFFPGNLLNLFKKDKEIPGYGTTYIDMEEPDERYEDYIERGLPPPAITPFDDSNREAGIASLYGQGPKWGGTNRRYEDEYRDYVERSGNMVGGPMTYEEFSEAWEGIHQGKPHAGLR
jgi:hypothetical protein